MAHPASDTTLINSSLAQLMDLNVSSALKRGQRYFDVASAIYVISAADIRHSGARSIPEALRLAPGVEVQRINANQYAISIRGHNNMFARKLLVLMDGRPLYSPSFSGVWWPAQNYPLEEIERIEVLRGPSGAVWGSNAVNGIINIITKAAHDTQGAHLSAGLGNEERGFGNIRYGGSGKHSDWRLYLMKEQRDGGALDKTDPMKNVLFSLTNPSDLAQYSNRAPDSRQMVQGGFRWDATLGKRRMLTLHGDSYRVDAGSFFFEAVPGSAMRNSQYRNRYRGKNMLLRYEQGFLAPGNRASLQLFADQTTVRTRFFGEKRTTYDGELQIDLALLPRNLISLGYSHRNARAKTTGSDIFQSPSQTIKIDSWFINDDITLMNRHWHLILGLKNERNQFSGWELQPHIRTIWRARMWSLWGAWSKGVRIPNQTENGIRFHIKSGPGYTALLVGDGRTKAERVKAYEIGIRLHPDHSILAQATAFWMRYDNLRDSFVDKAHAYTDTANGYRVIPVYFGNFLRSRQHGIEADITWQANRWLILKGSYSYLHQNVVPLGMANRSSLFNAATYSQQSPERRFTLSGSITPGNATEFNIHLYHWSGFRRNLTTKQYRIPAYTRVDARAAWRIREGMTFEINGHDLTKRSHIENQAEQLDYASLVERSYFVKITWDY